MKKFTLLLSLFLTATMTIFAQDASTPENVAELRLLDVRPSTKEDINRIENMIIFTFSEYAQVAEDAVEVLEMKNASNEVIAKFSLTSASTYENQIGIYIVPLDTIWHEYEEQTYPEFVYPEGLDTPGEYTVTIPAGTFVSVQDENISIAETTLTFNVVAPDPEWWTDYDYTSEVREIETLNISFSYTDNVELNPEKTPMLYNESGNQYTGRVEKIEEVDDKEGKKSIRLVVSFDKITEVGNYYIVIPAEMFTMHGANGEIKNEQKQLPLKVVAPVQVTPLEIDTVAPTFGENGQLEAITIVYNQNVWFGNEDWSNYAVNLTDADGNNYAMWPKSAYDAQGYKVIPDNTVVLIPTEVYVDDKGYSSPKYDDSYQILLVPITTPGTYTFNLADATVHYGYDNVNFTYLGFGSVEGTYTYEVTNTTAIEDVEADTENAVIYDLTGRRIEKITNDGIYIVNGVKKVIKL